jgi:adenylate cyclase
MTHVADFERSTSEAVGARDGRVVKHIGDEVMYVTPNAADACEIALELRDRFDTSQGKPGLRGGIAFGDLVRGYGDFYGPLVNLAARAVTLADPGSILVTEEVRSASISRPGLSFAPIGARDLRGFDAPIALYTLERG